MNSLPVTMSPARISTLTVVTSVASPTAAATILAENTGRVSYLIVNDSTAVLYIKEGHAASATDFNFKLVAGERYEPPTNAVYPGLITGLWASANGQARVTERTEV